MPDEDELISWLRSYGPRGAKAWIGDDAAILPAESFAVTTDTQIEGVHFLRGLDPAVVARRLLAVNLSDLAATGARPRYAMLALAAPAGFDHRRFFRALWASLRRYGMELVGGDLARSSCVTAVLTVFGSRYGNGRWLERGGAEEGQELWTGGCVGESAAGALLVRRGAGFHGRRIRLPEGFEASPSVLKAARRAVRRHLVPRPQVELGEWLSRQGKGAAIDCSDGLARDLHRLCRESGVGAQVRLAALPLGRNFQELCETIGCDAQDLALGGGEDYVLIFTLEPGLEPPRELGCRSIGRISRGLKVEAVDGEKRQALPPLGWDHLRLPGEKKDPAEVAGSA